MSYRRLLVLYGLILLLVAAQTYSLGAEDHGPAPDSPAGTSRPEADTKLNPDIAESLAKLFPIFTKESALERYETSLPKAFDEIKKNNEEPIADIVSEIFGTLNDQQVVKLETDVQNEIDAEKAKDREKQDKNKLDLLWRIKEAVMSVLKKEGNKDLAKFREAFEKKFQAVKDKNKEFYKLLEDALTNDAAKRKLLGEGYDPVMLLRFAKEQCASGNQSLCDKLAKGLTFEDTKTGERFMDVTTKDNKNQRLQIGKEADFKESITDLAEQTDGFKGLKLATKPHETVAPENIIRPKKQNPATRPAPPAARPRQQPPPQAPAPRPVPAAPANGTNNGSGGGASNGTGNNGNGGGAQPTTAQQLAAKREEVATIATNKCNHCHSDGVLTEKTPAEIKAVMDDGSMPPRSSRKGPLTDAEKTTIRDWLRLQNL